MAITLIKHTLAYLMASLFVIYRYFKFYEWYGLSCFGKIAVASEAERGVRMKCVGILADNYEMLHVHKDFLQRQVK